MSSVCSKCRRKVEHYPECCPKNYEGSAKGMEACGAARIVDGAARIVDRLFQQEEDKCYVACMVTDDDISVRKVLTHSFQELIHTGRVTADDWPPSASNRKKPDNGLLNVRHPKIKFYADKGHRVRGYAGAIFNEAYKNKANGCGCTKGDAKRMKRRLSYTLRMHCGSKYQEFKTAVLAVYFRSNVSGMTRVIDSHPTLSIH
jgi:hypothetical protein